MSITDSANLVRQHLGGARSLAEQSGAAFAKVQADTGAVRTDLAAVRNLQFQLSVALRSAVAAAGALPVPPSPPVLPPAVEQPQNDGFFTRAWQG